MIEHILSGLHRNLLPVAAAALIAAGAAHDASAATTTTYATTAATMPIADTTTAASAGDNVTTNPGPSISGFRNAEFGMTLAQVRRVIETEFKLPASSIKAGVNAIQHTDVLDAQVPDLIPGGGTANVSYVFGYQSHKLIEISVVWSKAIDPSITPQQIYQNGESLQQYFAGEGFPPQRSSGNIATSNGLILFRATDPTGNAVVLVFSGTMTKDPKSDKVTLDPTTLTLAYASDPQHPDVFQLNKGSF
jgi:hypothetical protein